MSERNRIWRWITLAALALVCAGALRMPVNLIPLSNASTGDRTRPRTLDLSALDNRPPDRSLNFLFLHHSIGGQLMADPGAEVGTNSIDISSPNGGGLRTLLEHNSYRTHEASYGSRFGENTDVFDWIPKFRDHLDDVLLVDSQDNSYTNTQRNQIVAFKSCFPNNAFEAEGDPPGNPSGPRLTVANAKAAYTGLLDVFQNHPDVLFVCFTTPPFAPPQPRPLWRQILHRLRGRVSWDVSSAALAREFNQWLSDTNGWLKDCRLTNVVVFDYYDILTDHGASDFNRYATGGGYDSHPSREGNTKAAEAFVPFLNQAVRRAGLAP